MSWVGAGVCAMTVNDRRRTIIDRNNIRSMNLGMIIFIGTDYLLSVGEGVGFAFGSTVITLRFFSVRYSAATCITSPFFTAPYFCAVMKSKPGSLKKTASLAMYMARTIVNAWRVASRSLA